MVLSIFLALIWVVKVLRGTSRGRSYAWLYSRRVIGYQNKITISMSDASWWDIQALLKVSFPWSLLVGPFRLDTRMQHTLILPRKLTFGLKEKRVFTRLSPGLAAASVILQAPKSRGSRLTDWCPWHQSGPTFFCWMLIGISREFCSATECLTTKGLEGFWRRKCFCFAWSVFFWMFCKLPGNSNHIFEQL